MRNAAAKAAARIRSSPKLSIVPLTGDRMRVCNVCGKETTELGVWRAHDEYDRPIRGSEALVFLGVGEEHKACHAKLDAHPRLFAEVAGLPGHFGLLCGPCVHRKDLRCTNPASKSNGGPGLLIEADPMSGIVCMGRVRGGCHAILQRVRTCAGREVAEGTP
jgi:hypothetical protein